MKFTWKVLSPVMYRENKRLTSRWAKGIRTVIYALNVFHQDLNEATQRW